MSQLAQFLIFAASAVTFSVHAQRLEKKECASYVIVELTLNNVWSQNVSSGAFIHDSVYVGVGGNPSEAAANAIKSCMAGNYSEEKCTSATEMAYAATDSRYSEVAKGLTGCF